MMVHEELEPRTDHFTLNSNDFKYINYKVVVMVTGKGVLIASHN